MKLYPLNHYFEHSVNNHYVTIKDLDVVLTNNLIYFSEIIAGFMSSEICNGLLSTLKKAELH